MVASPGCSSVQTLKKVVPTLIINLRKMSQSNIFWTITTFLRGIKIILEINHKTYSIVDIYGYFYKLLNGICTLIVQQTSVLDMHIQCFQTIHAQTQTFSMFSQTFFTNLNFHRYLLLVLFISHALSCFGGNLLTTQLRLQLQALNSHNSTQFKQFDILG